MAQPTKSLAALQESLDVLESRLNGATNQDEALKAAMDAAQVCLEALKIASTGEDKTSFRVQARAFLSQAESIKGGQHWSRCPPAADGVSNARSGATTTTPLQTGKAQHKRLQAPQNTRQLSRKEQVVVLKASKLHGYKFPPWQAGSATYLGTVSSVPGTPSDLHDVLRLSSGQQLHFLRWARLGTSRAGGPALLKTLSNLSSVMSTSKPIDLVQDVASDCSVVASLCMLAAREERGHFSLLPDILYPHDETSGLPVISPNGRYVARLNFNGSFRVVMIDDWFPESTGGRLLHTVDLNCPNLIWPALLEKAYLKVRGGYDFPGSNTCTDLWTLTGWVPEQIFLEDDETDLRIMWPKIQKAHGFGDVMISFGTGKLSAQMEAALNLASEHSYALISVREEHGLNKVLLKNPWRDSSSELLEGISEPAMREDETERRSNSNTPNDQPSASKVVMTKPTEERGDVSGTFWMNLDEILQNFESMYLNWNPGLFSHRNDVHFTWTISDKRNSTMNLITYPQFSLSAGAGTEIWLLLCRHFTESAPSLPTPPRTLPGSASTANLNSEEPSSNSLGFLSLYAFTSQGNRVRSNVRPSKRSLYVDSNQILLRLTAQPGQQYTLVPSEQGLASGEHNFTLIAFSTASISLDHAHNPYMHSTNLGSAWNVTNAGGNSESATFSSNPQFALGVARKTQLAIMLESQEPALSVNVKLLYGGGRRLAKISRQDIVADSGDYRAGVTHLEVEIVEAGDYTVICSTFEAGQESSFKLQVDSTEQCMLVALPGEYAGRFRVNPGVANFATGITVLAAPLYPKRLTKITAIAKHHIGRDSTLPGAKRSPNPRSRSPIRLSIAIGRGDHARYLTMSNGGEFDSSQLGVRTTDMDMWPDMKPANVGLWLVMERLCPSVSDGDIESYNVELLTDGERKKDWDIGSWVSWD